MLFVWWAALRLSVYRLTVKERRCDTSEGCVTPLFLHKDHVKYYFLKNSVCVCVLGVNAN